MCCRCTLHNVCEWFWICWHHFWLINSHTRFAVHSEWKDRKKEIAKRIDLNRQWMPNVDSVYVIRSNDKIVVSALHLHCFRLRRSELDWICLHSISNDFRKILNRHSWASTKNANQFHNETTLLQFFLVFLTDLIISMCIFCSLTGFVGFIFLLLFFDLPFDVHGHCTTV